MEEHNLAFLKGVSQFWRQTENRECQRHVFENLMLYTDIFLGRLENDHVEAKKLKGGDETEAVKEIMDIGKQTYSIEKLILFYTENVDKSADISFHKSTSLGLIPGCGHFLYSVADYIASISHIMPAARFANAGACDMEESVVKWVSRIIGYPEAATGVMVSGTSMGAVVAFAAARDHLLSSSAEYKRTVVYLPSHTHQSNQRSLRVVGLADCVYRCIPFVKQRMVPEALENMVLEDKQKGLIPFLVVGSMGSFGVGSLDPFEDIVKVTQEYNMWFHVDASYGGFFLLDDDVKKRCRGLELADSITLDFHKGLSAPYGTAVALVKDKTILLSSMTRDSGCVPKSRVGYCPIDLSFEYTRPFRAFPVWFLLKTLGTDAVTSQMTEKIKLAEYAYKKLSQMKNVFVYMKPDLTIIAFRYNPADNNDTKKWLESINESGEIFVTETIIEGLLYIRLCILSFRTHLETIEKALRCIARTLTLLHETKLLD